MCRDRWGSNDATVACKQLGYYGYINYYTYAYYGWGSGSIWLNNLNCRGNEISLFSCPGNKTGIHNCGHYEDVGVRCYCKYLINFFLVSLMMPTLHLISARDTSSCTNGTVKLWSAYSSTPDDEGIVLICRNGVWYPIYQYLSCRNVAEIFCSVNSLKLECESVLYLIL